MSPLYREVSLYITSELNYKVLPTLQKIKLSPIDPGVLCFANVAVGYSGVLFKCIIMVVFTQLLVVHSQTPNCLSLCPNFCPLCYFLILSRKIAYYS